MTFVELKLRARKEATLQGLTERVQVSCDAPGADHELGRVAVLRRNRNRNRAPLV
jgi:hypothetical protein